MAYGAYTSDPDPSPVSPSPQAPSNGCEWVQAHRQLVGTLPLLVWSGQVRAGPSYLEDDLVLHWYPVLLWYTKKFAVELTSTRGG